VSGARRLRSGLVICEFSLACALCCAAVLLVRSSIVLNARDHGFQSDGVLTFQLALSENAFPRPEKVAALYEELLRRWRDIPGIVNAGLATNLPWTGYDENTSFAIAGDAMSDAMETPQARFQAATPGFFEALRFRLLGGRFFDERDRAGAPPVVVVNETLARRFLADRDPVGSVLEIWGTKCQVVGVVADVRDSPADPQAEPAFWWPIAQQPFSRVQVVLRSGADPISLLAAAGAVVRELDRELPLAEVRTMDDVAGAAMSERRFALLLFQAFAALAVVLAGIGVYGLLAYVVQQRRKELGIRMALGATRSKILSAVVRDGLLLAAVGSAIGVALAPAAARTLSALLYGVTAADAFTLLAAPAIIIAASVIASAVPAWTASRSGILSTLREQ
jgi:predicted permease